MIAIIARAGINLSILIECSTVIKKYPIINTEIITASILKKFCRKHIKKNYNLPLLNH